MIYNLLTALQRLPLHLSAIINVKHIPTKIHIMKKLPGFLFFATVFLFSCSGQHSYTLETFYKNDGGNGDTTLTSDKNNISADNDSSAFIKAQDKFNDLKAKPDEKRGAPVKFTLRNHDGVIIISPRQDTTQENTTAYPNQKSPD